MRAWRWTGVSWVALLFGGALWVFAPPPVAVEAPPPSEPLSAEAPPAPVAGPSLEGVPGGYADAHAAIARELGYVATHCYVGPEWDSDDLVGKFHQVVADGWYSHVETTLTGRRLVERRITWPGVPDDAPLFDRIDFADEFFVSWDATEPGQSVPCTVEHIARGALRVTVVDQQGHEVDGVRVSGCGTERVAVDGRARLDGYRAGEWCTLRALCLGKDWCDGRLELAPLDPGEQREVTFEVWSEVPATREEKHEHMLTRPRWTAPPPDPLELSDDQELVRLQRMATRDLPPHTAELVDRLVARKLAIMERAAARRAIRDEIDELTAERRANPDDREQLGEALEARRQELYELR